MIVPTFYCYLQMEMELIWNKIKETNDEQIQKMCQDKLKKVYEKCMHKKIKRKAYEKIGGHRIFQRDLDVVKIDYFAAVQTFEETKVRKEI